MEGFEAAVDRIVRFMLPEDTADDIVACLIGRGPFRTLCRVHRQNLYVALERLDPARLTTWPALIKMPSTDLPAMREAHDLRREMTTVEVTLYLRDRSTFGLPPADQSTHVPIRIRSEARPGIALRHLGGDLPDPVKQLDHDWYDLTAVPVGGSVWLRDLNGTVSMFTHKHPNLWLSFVFPEPTWPDVTYQMNTTTFTHRMDSLLAGAALATMPPEECET